MKVPYCLAELQKSPMRERRVRLTYLFAVNESDPSVSEMFLTLKRRAVRSTNKSGIDIPPPTMPRT